ncbi:zinc ribbon domain-containing protein [bacterium]|jgi:putative FmdB family regulatory protein|nr:zinc ribbon domain-containing protein [bacterium]
MAIYEYYCTTCKEKFDKRRPMSEAAAAVTCASGHRAERTITAFAVARGGADAGEFSMPAGGGCACGGNCGCGSLN